MNTKEWLHKRLPFTALILSLILFVLSLASNNAGSNTDKVALETASRIEKRLSILEDCIQTALETDKKELILPEGLPEDMVIYRYINDSLQSWSNQFSIINDNISSLLVFQRLTDRRSQIISPLTEVTDEISYLNFGPKWYLVKYVTGSGGQKVIAGLEIKNTLIDDVRRYEIARIIMAYNKDKKTEIFNDLKQQNYLGEPEKYIPPKEYKYNSLRAILQEF